MGSDSVSDWGKPGMDSNPELNVCSGELGVTGLMGGTGLKEVCLTVASLI